ncbi:MAG: hypothetical protein KU37_10985 [Sulfuricurvum sp. PC08-66]|nr:MAG: hypothetical protein KU37_10985 [Sulfuricurvum sp. PC08-66]
MSRVLSVVVMGGIMGLFPWILLGIGIKLHYFDALGLGQFYNALFIRHMPWEWYAPLALFIGVLFVYPRRQHFVVFFYIALLAASMSTLWAPYGFAVGQALFETPHFTIKHKRFLYQGVLQYEDKNYYYLLDDEANRTIKFAKGEVIEAY